MWNRNKKPVLTATFCEEMEKLRLALEVLRGREIRFLHLDMNTGRARVQSLGAKAEPLVGKNFTDVLFTCGQSDFLDFELESEEFEGNWYTARYDKSGEVRVIGRRTWNVKFRQGHKMWHVGRSSTDRWEEPLDLRAVEYIAQKNGLSVKDYLGL